jgi:hypothetical protein
VTVALSVFSRSSIVVLLVTLSGSHAFAQAPAAPDTGQRVPEGAPPKAEAMPVPAPAPVPVPAPAPAGDASTFIIGKWSTTLYGFVQTDAMYNSTQSFNDFAGNQQVLRPGTYGGDNGRTVFTARDSRFGVRLRAPAPTGYGFTANLEGDFIGSEPGIYQNTGGTAPTPGTTNTEPGYFTNPTFRIRQAVLKAETPFLDFTLGQTWNLLGWQAGYLPTIIQWPGILGELFGRSPQWRVSKTIKTDTITFEAAAAAMRPAQRDSTIPNGEGGVRLAFNQWAGVHTSYMPSTSVQPLSIAVTGDVRSFKVPAFVAEPHATNKAVGGAFAVDAFIPIIPGTLTKKDNALAVTGEFAQGSGIADQYTAMATGISNPALPPAMMGGASPAFPSHLDSGLAAYDAAGALHLVKIQSWFVNGEYYLPAVGGRVALFGGYYNVKIRNTADFASAPAAMRSHASMIDAGFFVDATPAIRLGADYALIRDVYADGVTAKNNGIQGSAFFFF